MPSSSAPVETEIKIALATQAQYQSLCALLGKPVEILHQVNCFFDTRSHELGDRQLALRLRSENDRGVLTLKGPMKMHGAAQRRMEIEYDIGLVTAQMLIDGDVEPAQHISAAIHDLIAPVQPSQLIEVMRFYNLRRTYWLELKSQRLLLEVDHTSYADETQDYEIEIEFSSELNADDVNKVQQALYQWLRSHSIEHSQQLHSKLARAKRHSALPHNTPT